MLGLVLLHGNLEIRFPSFLPWLLHCLQVPGHKRSVWVSRGFVFRHDEPSDDVSELFQASTVPFEFHISSLDSSFFCLSSSRRRAAHKKKKKWVWATSINSSVYSVYLTPYIGINMKRSICCPTKLTYLHYLDELVGKGVCFLLLVSFAKTNRYRPREGIKGLYFNSYDGLLRPS